MSPKGHGICACALVDYDNVRLQQKEYSPVDAAAKLLAIRRVLLQHCMSLSVIPDELHIRLYGGWLNERGHYTQRAEWVLSQINTVRGRVNGVRVVPDVVIAIAECGSKPLFGLVRTIRSLRAQKMVDTMIAVDAIHFADGRSGPLLIVSDDDDIVPPALAARARWEPVVLFRRRGPGQGLNDGTCESQGVSLLALPEEFQR